MEPELKPFNDKLEADKARAIDAQAKVDQANAAISAAQAVVVQATKDRDQANADVLVSAKLFVTEFQKFYGIVSS
jgi:hypothetical protein